MFELWTFLLAIALALLVNNIVCHAHSYIECMDPSREAVESAMMSDLRTNHAPGHCSMYPDMYSGVNGRNVDQVMTVKFVDGEYSPQDDPCSNSRTKYTTSQSPYSVKAGQRVYYGYGANGHIVNDDLGHDTNVAVYSTGKADSKISSINQLKEELILTDSVHNFDDGQCDFNIARNGSSTGRRGDGYLCIGYFEVPLGLSGDIMFVWSWSTQKLNSDGTKRSESGAVAIYNTCFTLHVIENEPIAGPPRNTYPPVVDVDSLSVDLPEESDFAMSSDSQSEDTSESVTDKTEDWLTNLRLRSLTDVPRPPPPHLVERTVTTSSWSNYTYNTVVEKYSP